MEGYSRMIKIGIVGTGSTFGIAHYHAQGVLLDGRACVSAVFSHNKERAGKWVSDHGLSSRVCNSYEELLDNVDAVVICTPNAFHCNQVLQAIEAGKHILVEKPVAITADECKLLREACVGYGKVNMAGFSNRSSGIVLSARKIIREQMGKVFLFSAWFGGKRLADPSVPLEWRMQRSLSGSGALGDFGSHAVDLADFMCSQRYDEVSCMTAKYIAERPLGKVENDDVALFQGRSNNGLGSFSMSRVGMTDTMIAIAGEGGLMELDFSGSGRLFYTEKKLNGPYTGKTAEIVPEKPSDFSSNLASQMTAFIDAIKGVESKASANIADVNQGCYVENVLLAAEKASETRYCQEL